jgi:hypothetical protein
MVRVGMGVDERIEPETLVREKGQVTLGVALHGVDECGAASPLARDEIGLALTPVQLAK